MTEQENTNEVIAWRLTAVEDAVRGVSAKLDNMVKGFVTHKDIEVAKDQAKIEHDAIYEKIADVEKDVQGIKSKNWIYNTMSAIFGSILTFLILYFLQDIIK